MSGGFRETNVKFSDLFRIKGCLFRQPDSLLLSSTLRMNLLELPVKIQLMVRQDFGMCDTDKVAENEVGS